MSLARAHYLKLGEEVHRRRAGFVGGRQRAPGRGASAAVVVPFPRGQLAAAPAHFARRPSLQKNSILAVWICKDTNPYKRACLRLIRIWEARARLDSSGRRAVRSPQPACAQNCTRQDARDLISETQHTKKSFTSLSFCAILFRRGSEPELVLSLFVLHISLPGRQVRDRKQMQCRTLAELRSDARARCDGIASRQRDRMTKYIRHPLDMGDL